MIKLPHAMKKITDLPVYIVDDDSAVLDSIAMLLRPENLRIRTYFNSHQFLEDFDPQEGGCLVLDINMPGMSGLDLQRHLSGAPPLAPIIFITGNADVPKAVQALKSGALDFIEKPFSPDALLASIRRALEISYDRLQNFIEQEKSSQIWEQLTQREIEILKKITEGKANKVIAYELGISQRTAEVHRANIMRKAQVHSLAELVKLVTP